MTLLAKRKPLFIGVVVLIITFTMGQYYLFGKKIDKSATARPNPLVSVTFAQITDLPNEFSAQGHLVALNQVEVRPQITGVIRTVDFHEGDQIKAGQLLFTLDATDVTAQVSRYDAQSAQIKAQLDDANRDYNRSKELVKSGFISSGAVATSQSKAESLQAQMKAAGAEIESARVQLSYTRITAPISGQAGALAIHPGSLAQTSAASPLVTLLQMDPIGMEFSLPEQALGPILAARAAGQIKATLQTQDNQTAEGKLTFVNNTVNTDTATINLKASFPNTAQRLWPGGFARIILRAGSSKGAVVLPPNAILEGPSGRFVYVVGSDNKVTSRPVTLLRIQDGYAVLEGLKGGERVVLDGGQNLSNGSTVTIDNKGSPAHPTDKADTKPA